MRLKIIDKTKDSEMDIFIKCGNCFPSSVHIFATIYFPLPTTTTHDWPSPHDWPSQLQMWL